MKRLFLALTLTFLGQHHRALSDAENVAQLFRRLV
jgi:inhibitor of KinA sporulation pathway (predicted exonuclease)